MINATTKNRIAQLKASYDAIPMSRRPLLHLLAEREIPEMVYNSNAIENSTLSLAETEAIIFKNKIPHSANVREVYEAKNLANILTFLQQHPHYSLSEPHILELHRMLISGINNYIAGRFRERGEHVRVGWHIAPAPEHIPNMIDDILYAYAHSDAYFLDRIAQFHARFEYIHPFNDGNGRTGRVLTNLQLRQFGYPPITIFAKNREKDYYPLFEEYRKTREHTGFTELFARLLCESLHKRLTYVNVASEDKIIKLSDWARAHGEDVNSLLNAARRQAIPAFRERGVWMIASDWEHD